MNIYATVVLAAGKGTRMRSAHPKVLHPLVGVPLLAHVLKAVEAIPSTSSFAPLAQGTNEKLICAPVAPRLIAGALHHARTQVAGLAEKIYL